jgi:hypothetical protein
LLQFVKYIRSDQAVQLAVVISAWDLVQVESQTWRPGDLVEKRMPLLWQYIKSNADVFNVVFFGISAQGGELKDSERLLEIGNPCDRVKLVEEDGTESTDITLPIKAILGGNNGEEPEN